MKKLFRMLITVALAAMILSALYINASAIELKTGIGIVEGNGLRLRAKPDTNAEILANAAYGDSVVVIREVNGWYLVDYNLQIGYMSADYITVKDRENVELGNGVVEDTVVNLRAKPDPAGELLAQLTTGDTAYIIGFNCGWYKVQYAGKTGYIRSDLLALTEKPIANSDGSGSYISIGQELVNYSMTFLGTPYVWGGTTPRGFDCSGFTKYVYAQMGYTLDRTAAQQLNNGTSISKSELEIGDLVFFKNTYNTNAAASHVGIYIGDNQFIHAADGGVKITSLDHSYYAPRYVGARSVI